VFEFSSDVGKRTGGVGGGGEEETIQTTVKMFPVRCVKQIEVSVMQMCLHEAWDLRSRTAGSNLPSKIFGIDDGGRI
jgi:hypothetical protein